MKRLDILIKNGRIYDGTGTDPVTADIGIAGDKIAFVAESPGRYEGAASRVINAEGLSVSPGFIDVHAHSDFTLLADGRAEGKVFQGVTTEINGNCGLSAAPLYGEALEHRVCDLKELGIRDRWSTFREYFALLEKAGFALNYATLAGQGNIRASVVGYENRAPKISEKQKMELILRDAVDEGAIGLSTGLIYPPGVYSKTEEIIELSRHISGLIYTTHMRSEGDELIEAIEEAVRIGRESGIAVHISHIKTGGKRNWHKIDRAISVIDTARSEGMRVTCDRYPYTASSTDLDTVLPFWTYEGGVENELDRLKDPVMRNRITDEVVSHNPPGEYWEDIIVSSVQLETNKWMEGKTLQDISLKVNKEPVDCLIDILIEEKLRVAAIFRSMNEDNLKKFLSLPYLMIGSDSSARSFDGPTRVGKPHPRTFGTFPRLLGRYAREMAQMSMSGAIHKTTALTADTFGLKGRGRINSGYFADLVIFDEEKITDGATFEEPFLKPVGIHHVLVNGTPVIWDGASTGARPGRVLRNGG